MLLEEIYGHVAAHYCLLAPKTSPSEPVPHSPLYLIAISSCTSLAVLLASFCNLMRVVCTPVLLPRHSHIVLIHPRAGGRQSANDILQELHRSLSIVMRRANPLTQTFEDMYIHDKPAEIVTLGSEGVDFVRDARWIPVDRRHLLDD